MSTVELFEVMGDEEWAEVGAVTSQRGEYKSLLEQIVNAGVKFARIPTDKGPFNGRKASTLVTSLKGARDAKDAPDTFEGLKISSKKGAIYIHNTAVA